MNNLVTVKLHILKSKISQFVRDSNSISGMIWHKIKDYKQPLELRESRLNEKNMLEKGAMVS